MSDKITELDQKTKVIDPTPEERIALLKRAIELLNELNNLAANIPKKNNENK
jgi:hypothetical protein